MEMVTVDRASIPTTPGVYFFRDGRGRVLYVGKASVLRNRLASYFQPAADLGPAKRRLLEEATNITWEETGSEIEALLREAHEIKQRRPPYNVLLRDDKTFLSVKVTREQFPRVLTTRKIEADGGTYFGPFADARAVHETLKVLRRAFPYRTTCRPNSGRLCLDAHLGLCPGVCAGRLTAAEYRRRLRYLKLFFAGKRRRLVAALRREAAQQRRRRDDVAQQRAAALEQQVRFLEKVLAMAHVLAFGEKATGDVADLARALGLAHAPRRIEGYDVSHLQGSENVAAMAVFTDGQADKSSYRKFKIAGVVGSNDVASVAEVLRRRFTNHRPGSADPWPTPDLVVVDGGRPQLSAALGVWRELGLRLPLVSLAKRYEEVFTPAAPHPLLLARTSGALHLLQRVRDEAHRFAISYHKTLRRRRLVGR
jgi:excinuclease ABC subunit C